METAARPYEWGPPPLNANGSAEARTAKAPELIADARRTAKSKGVAQPAGTIDSAVAAIGQVDLLRRLKRVDGF